MSSSKLGVGVTMVVCQLALLGAPSPAQALATTVEPIPTDVVGPPKSSQYPQPICSICKVEASRETNSFNQTRGLLFIAYEDEVYEDFEGEIEVTLLLSDDSQYVQTILDVELSDDEEMTWVLQDPAAALLAGRGARVGRAGARGVAPRAPRGGPARIARVGPSLVACERAESDEGAPRRH